MRAWRDRQPGRDRAYGQRPADHLETREPLRSDLSWWWPPWGGRGGRGPTADFSALSDSEPRLSDRNFSRAPRSSCSDFRRSSRNMVFLRLSLGSLTLSVQRLFAPILPITVPPTRPHLRSGNRAVLATGVMQGEAKQCSGRSAACKATRIPIMNSSSRKTPPCYFECHV